MQRLERETEAGRFTKRRTVSGEPKEREGDGENVRPERWAEASSHHADLDFIRRVKESDRQGFGFQKDPFGCDKEDRLERGKGKSREIQAEASALVQVTITGTTGHLDG